MRSRPNCRGDNPLVAHVCAECGADLGISGTLLANQAAALIQAGRAIAAPVPARSPVGGLPIIVFSTAYHKNDPLEEAPPPESSRPARRFVSSYLGTNRRSPAPSGGGPRRAWPGVAALLLVCAMLVFALVGLPGFVGWVESLAPRAAANIDPTISTVSLAPTSAAKPGAAVPPTVVPGTMLLADDFDTPARSHLLAVQNDIATYAFIGGAYAITLKQPGHIARSSLGGSYSDIAVETDATFGNGPSESAAGIIFRYQDDDNFYLYRISDTGSYSLAVYSAGQQQMLLDWTASPAINPRGQPNKLRVEAVGEHMRLFVNGRLLGEASDMSLRTGEVALAVSTFSQGGTTVLFDNLVVRSLS
jgi:hypothetical protein